jgi:hypothetical protein
MGLMACGLVASLIDLIEGPLSSLLTGSPITENRPLAIERDTANDRLDRRITYRPRSSLLSGRHESAIFQAFVAQAPEVRDERELAQNSVRAVARDDLVAWI